MPYYPYKKKRQTRFEFASACRQKAVYTLQKDGLSHPFEFFQRKIHKRFSSLETLFSKLFLMRVSSGMVFLEAAPQPPKKVENKLKNEFDSSAAISFL